MSIRKTRPCPVGIDEVTIDSNTSQCVYTPDLEEAEELLQEMGQVVLCGPPGCGKSTLALALLRRSKEKGFNPHVIPKLEKLDNTNIETSVANGPIVLLLDGTLGTVRVDRHQHDLWTAKRPGLMELVDQGRCRLIITLYPHVLREMMQLEGGAHSPMANRSLAVQMGKTLDSEIKEQMLKCHLEKLPPKNLGEAEHSKVVETVLQTDRSGPGFPWCCHRLMQYWSSSKDLAIFSAPEETHALLFDKMVTHPIHGRLFAAVLALIMRGFHGFLHRPGQAQPELTRLGFDAFSDDQLAEYADVLRGSILTEDGEDFASRVLYDAAALALGRSFRLVIVLRACDLSFLVQHAWAKLLTAHVSGTIESKLSITVGSFACSSASRPILATSEDLRSMLNRVYGEIMSGHLPEISQHQSLQCPEFLLALERYCEIHSQSVQQLVNVVDPVHGLSLVYWSVFSRSDTLTQWCFTHMIRTKSGRKLLSPRVLLACALFDHLVVNSTCRLQSLLTRNLTRKHFTYKTDTVSLPLLTKNQCLTKDSQQYIDIITGSDSPERVLHYLHNPSLPIPKELIKVQVSKEKVVVRVGDRREWYLAQRLTADRKVNGKDRKGNTLLHAALNTGNPDIIQLVVKGGGSLLERNSQGKTAYHVAKSKRGLQRWRGSSSVDEYFTAIRSGDIVKVKTLLCQGVCVEDRDSEGHSGRYVACKAGQTDIADFLIQLEAQVDTKGRTGSISLHDAARKGHTNKVNLLLCEGTDINVQDKDGFTPLHHSVIKGHTDTADLLLHRGANVSAENKAGVTPLICAASEGHTETADLLIHHGSQANLMDMNGLTPLDYTALKGHTDTADLLLRHGAHVNVQDKDGFTPLHSAAQEGHTGTADLLIHHGAQVNAQSKDGFTPLHSAAGEGHTDTADLLIRHGSLVNAQNKYGSTPLHYAAGDGHRGTAELLIRHGSEVNVQEVNGLTPLYYAVCEGHTDTADLLIRQGSHISVQNKDGRTPLHYATREGHIDTAELLIQHGSQVNLMDMNGLTPLDYTALKGYTDTADLLLRHGANVNVQDKDGFTPLHNAAQEGHTGTADLLIHHGAQVNAQSKHGFTPLHSAAGEGHTDTADLLIRRGSQVNVQNKYGSTPLHYAARDGRTGTAELLIRHGAEVNAQKANGLTPLYYAVSEGHTDTANLLLRHGSQVNVQNKYGRTPLHYAVTEGRTDTAGLLIRHGSKVNTQDVDGSTPLHSAVRKDRTDTVNLLIKRGAYLNVQDTIGHTPLQIALSEGHTSTTDLLRYNCAL